MLKIPWVIPPTPIILHPLRWDVREPPGQRSPGAIMASGHAFDQLRDAYLKIYSDLDSTERALESEAAIQALETGVDVPSLLRRIAAIKKRLPPLEEKLQKVAGAKRLLVDVIRESLLVSAGDQEELRVKCGLPPNPADSENVGSLEECKCMVGKVEEELGKG